MKTLDMVEARSISGGKTVYCPICGKKSSVWFFWPVKDEEEKLSAAHNRGGWFNRSSSVHSKR